MIADKIVNIFWSTIKDYRGDTLPYLYSSFDSCLYVLYCLYKGYHVHIDMSDALWENPKDQILQSFKELTSKESNEEITMRSLRIRARFLDSILTELHPDDIKEAYPSTISKLLTYSANTKDMLMYFTPAELVRVISRILRKYNVKHVYNPFAGTAAFCSELEESVSYIGEDNDPRAVTYALIRIDSLRRAYTNVICADSCDSLERICSEEKAIKMLNNVDAIISHTEDNQWNNSIYKDVRLEFLENTANGTKGISIGIYSYDILFDRVGLFSGLTDIFKGNPRKRLLEKDYIQTIIKLPTEMFAPKKRHQSCIIITNKRKLHKGLVQFIDATQCVNEEGKFSCEMLMEVLDNSEELHFVKWISCKELLSGRGALALELVLHKSIKIPEGFHLERLGDLIASLKGSHRTGFSPETMIPIINVRDLSRKPFENRLTDLEMASPTEAGFLTYLDRNALLVSVEGNLRATYYSYKDNGAFAEDNIAAYEIKEKKVSPTYLIRELWQPYVQDQLVYKRSGKLLALELFEEVRILVPDKIQEQKSIVEEIYQEQLSEKERELQKAHEEYVREIHTRKHALGNTFSAFTSLYKTLSVFILQQGHVSCDDVFGEPFPLTVEQALNTLTNYYKNVASQITHFTDIDSFYGIIEPIQLEGYIVQYIRDHHDNRFRYIFESSNMIKSAVLIPRRALDLVFNNIISNAVDHGFSNHNQKDYEIDFCVKDCEDSVVLEIANNGEPLANDFSEERVFELGESSKKDKGHSGMGGDDIKRVLKKYNASVSLKSTPNKKYTVTYVITFNDIKSNEYGTDND